MKEAISKTKEQVTSPLIQQKSAGVKEVPPRSGISFLDNKNVQRKENKTGMPDQLKSGVESLSGIDMSDVKVHYNSPQPAQLQAHAYAQGNQIHIAPGQEKHLPHEAWHVVQQKQGRVRATMQMKGNVSVNDNAGLEKEADVMGGKAARNGKVVQLMNNSIVNINSSVLQAAWVRVSDEVSRWDKPIDGVTWFGDAKGMMWFEITEPDLIVEGKLADYRQLAGKANEQPHEFWVRNHMFHLGNRVAGIEQRIGNYRAMIKSGDMEHESGKSRKINGGKYVDETYSHEESEVEGKPFKTHFLNHYSPEEAYMDENYRHKDFGKKFFASDVFLHQYSIAASGKDAMKGQPIQSIPERMPSKITRATISNAETKATLLRIFGAGMANHLVRPGDPGYKELIKTPNGAATINILSEYNSVNRARGGEISQ